MLVALRSLLRSPGFSLSVISTLGLAIAAASALFSAADALLLSPLPCHDARRLFTIVETHPDSQTGELVSIPNFLSLKGARSFVDVAAFRPWGFALTGAGDAERVAGARVTANLLTVLGVPLEAGRGFTADEDVHGGPRVAVISYGLWRRLGAPPDPGSRRVLLNGEAYDVVGVLRPDVTVPAADVLVPYGIEPIPPLALLMLSSADMSPRASVKPLRDEAEELVRILMTSRPTANARVQRKRAQQEHQERRFRSDGQ